MSGKQSMGIIYTGGSDRPLQDLTFSRSPAAIPFGGRYRLIDFVLSNMVNSGISNVGVIAQRNYHSLMDHMGAGTEWDLNRKRDGLFLLPPFVSRSNTGSYKGSVDALLGCMNYIRRSTQRYVVLSGAQTLYNMPYQDMLEQHISTGADITLLYSEEPPLPPNEQHNNRRLTLSPEGRVIGLQIDPYRSSARAQSCDAYILEKTLLEYLVEEAATRGHYHWSRDVLIHNLDALKIFGYRYDGYIARLYTTAEYFRHSMALLQEPVRAQLFHREHPIYTKVKDEVPAFYGSSANVKNSFVADGCRVEGTVENSILFRGAHVAGNATVRNSILMQAAQVQEHAELDYVILDKSVVIKNGGRLVGSPSFPVVLRKGVSI